MVCRLSKAPHAPERHGHRNAEKRPRCSIRRCAAVLRHKLLRNLHLGCGAVHLVGEPRRCNLTWDRHFSYPFEGVRQHDLIRCCASSSFAAAKLAIDLMTLSIPEAHCVVVDLPQRLTLLGARKRLEGRLLCFLRHTNRAEEFPECTAFLGADDLFDLHLSFEDALEQLAERAGVGQFELGFLILADHLECEWAVLVLLKRERRGRSSALVGCNRWNQKNKCSKRPFKHRFSFRLFSGKAKEDRKGF